MIKLLRFLKPFKIHLAASFILVVIRALAELYLPSLSADMVNIGIINGDIGYIKLIGLRMLLITATGICAFILAGYLSSRAAAGLARHLRQEVFAHVESFSLREFDRFGTASLVNRTTNDITHLQNFVIFALRMMVMAPILTVGCLILAYVRDAMLTLILVAVTPILFAAIKLIIGKGLPLFRTLQSRLDRLNLIVREGLMGVRVIRAFNRDAYENKRFKEANFEYASLGLRVNRIMGAMTPLITLIMNLTIIAIVWFGGIRIDNGLVNVGDLLALIQYAMQVMFSFIAISRIFLIIPRATASAWRINEIFDTIPEIKDPPQQGREQPIGNLEGYIEFRNVTFSYPEAENPVLRNISFRAVPGETTAIIGSTGSGKSTLVHLMLRLYDVSSGSITVDGVDIRQLPLQTLRRIIGFVPQRTLLFSGTVRDNICYGREDASEKDIVRAAGVAQIAGFVAEMDNGYDSAIAQEGKNVSGGQKQRLAIARALLKKVPIYIFDDSFSALDYATEARLRTALLREMADSAIFIISQRASTVRNADRIIVLDEGRIAGMGNHAELMSACHVYREIVASQQAGGETA